MFLARVTGTVVATVKDDALAGHKLLVIQPLDAAGHPLTRTLVALDAVGAGTGEVVYCCRGKEASFPFLPAVVPADAAIIGICDPESNPSFWRKLEEATSRAGLPCRQSKSGYQATNGSDPSKKWPSHFPREERA